mmetsp:Transcript_26415/g.83044  ORF Transcript_26415/g.83044 Transcript_26415/m.83044 type:complete len:185 (+) Transcript_26415:726-1280(+)
MLVRRGDACERWEGEALPLRPCWPLASYLRAARRLRERYGATHVHLATDSDRVAAEARAMGGRPFSFTLLRFNRSSVGGGEGSALHKSLAERRRVFIESRAADMDGSERALLLGSMLADVALLAEADMLVGDNRATMTRLALSAMVGRLGRVPPFVLLGGPLEGGVWGGEWPPRCPPGADRGAV